MWNENGDLMPYIQDPSEYEERANHILRVHLDEPIKYNALGKFANKVVVAIRERYNDPNEDKGKLMMLCAHYGNKAMINSSICQRA